MSSTSDAAAQKVETLISQLQTSEEKTNSDSAAVDINDEMSFVNGAPRFELGYWKTRNIGEPARLMLAYKNVKFTNTVYTQGNAQDPYSRDSWYQVKNKLNFSFPNLPYLIDNKHNLRLTESRAIYKYLARQLNIGSFQDPLQAKQEMLGDVVYGLYTKNMDVTYGFISLKRKGLPWEEKFEAAKKEYLSQTLPEILEQMESYLSNDENKNNKWLTDNELCFADFHFWYVLDINLNMDLKCLDKYSRVKSYYHNFRSLPSISYYLQNHESANYPMNSIYSNYGYTTEHNYTSKLDFK